MRWLGRGTDPIRPYRAPSQAAWRRFDIGWRVAILVCLGGVLWLSA